MTEFSIPAMTCSHCISRVTRAVRQADPTAKVEVDLPGRKVRVAGAEDRDTIAAALSQAGYPPA